MFKRWLDWMNDGELIPLWIAIPVLIAVFFLPMILLNGWSAPVTWFMGVLNAAGRL